MKIARILWALVLTTLLASCAGAHRGFNYQAHQRHNKKYARDAARRADQARHDLTQFDCGR